MQGENINEIQNNIIPVKHQASSSWHIASQSKNKFTARTAMKHLSPKKTIGGTDYIANKYNYFYIIFVVVLFNQIINFVSIISQSTQSWHETKYWWTLRYQL